MAASTNSFFDKLVESAIEQVAKKGLEATQKEITLASFGMLSKAIKNRMHSITKPFWWAAGAIGTGVVWFIISDVLNLVSA